MTLPALLLSLIALLLSPLIVGAVPVQLYGVNYNTRKGADWQPANLKCETYLEVKTDLTILSRLTNRIRILSLTDCGQGELVLKIAKELGLQVWLGIWVSEDPAVFAREVAALQDFLARGMIDDAVLGISVGSESIYREEVTIDEAIALKDEVKQVLVDAGKGDLPVSICEIAPTYTFNAEMTDNVDVVVLNSFPFWESVPIDDATDYLVAEVVPIQNRAANQGKGVIMGETGWPSDGFISGVGEASPENQQQFFTDFYCRMDKELGWQYYFFTGIDNAWRQEQDENNTIEGNWGMLFMDLQPKPWFADLEFTCPSDGVTYSFAEIDWTIPQVVAPPTISPAPTPPLGEEACAAHSGCVAVDLVSGNCCPTDEGVPLGCCGDLSSPTTASPGGATTTSPAPSASSPTVTSTTAEPSPSPAETTLEPTTSVPVSAPTTIAPTFAPSSDSEPTTTGDETTTDTPEPSTAPVSSPTTVLPTLEGGSSPSLPTTDLANAQPVSLNPTSSGEMARYCGTTVLLLCSMVVLM